MKADVVAGALSIHPGSVHFASVRSATKAPSSIHSNVARPRPTAWPSTVGSNSQVPMSRSSRESAIGSAASGCASADRVLGEDGVDLSDGLGHAFLLAHGKKLLHRLGAREAALDRHPRASVAELLDRHLHLAG